MFKWENNVISRDRNSIPLNGFDSKYPLTHHHQCIGAIKKPSYAADGSWDAMLQLVIFTEQLFILFYSENIDISVISHFAGENICDSKYCGNFYWKNNHGNKNGTFL